jgi:hypothetical protein
MAYLPSTHKIYAMSSYGGVLEVRAFDGFSHGVEGDWPIVATTNTPSERIRGGLCYDPVSGKLLLYGGCNSAASEWYDDTYLFDGTNFELQAVTVQPPPRMDHVLAPCNSQGTPALVGGDWYEDVGDGPVRRSTAGVWIWTGSDWLEIVSNTEILSAGDGTAEEQSLARWKAVGFYDSVAGGMVMNGGENFTTASLSDTWLFTYEPWQNGEDDPDGEGFNELTETDGGALVELYST